MWTDDFNGAAGTLPSSGNWIVDTGHSYPGGPANWGTWEVQEYTSNPANLSHDGAGNLKITPLRDASGKWTSGRIETQRTDFQADEGGKMRIQARIQMPNVTGSQALGYWPAFWTLGGNYRGSYWNWPGVGEFDIMENVNGVNSVWGVLHCGVNPGGPCNETDGIVGSRACPNSTCQSAFHTYTFEVDRTVTPEVMRWYVDGQQFHSVTESQIGSTTWAQAVHHGHFILLNVAMGGAFPDKQAGFPTPTSATVPGRSMLVDYVTVMKTGGTTGGTTGGFDPYGTTYAVDYDAQQGTGLETSSEGGQNVGWIGRTDWLRYDDANFGSTGAVELWVRYASNAARTGWIELRLDNVNNAPVGRFWVDNTGNWQSWVSEKMTFSTKITGTHDVYLYFNTDHWDDFVNVHRFQFDRT